MARDKRVWTEHTNRTDDGKGERNFRILRKMVESDPKDYRAVLYLAHQYFAAVDWPNACQWYEKFIALSSPGDVLEEKWQAMVYLAKARRSAGDIDGSLRAAKEALMMCPQYADSYFELAHDYALKDDWKRSAHWHEEGLTRTQPDNILILNPLDYSFNPFVISHGVYYKLNNLEQAIKDVRVALDHRPKDQPLVNSLLHYTWSAERTDAVRSAIRIAGHLLDTNEPIKARGVLANLPAGAVGDDVEKARVEVEERLAHLTDEVAYENFYFSEEDPPLADDALTFRFPRVDWAIARLKAMGAKKILEVGIGDGLPALRYADAGFQVVGVDIDPRRVQRANRMAVKLGMLTTELQDDPDLNAMIASNAQHMEWGKLQSVLAKEQAAADPSDTVKQEVVAELDTRIAATEARDKELKTQRDTAKVVTTPESRVQFHWGSAEDLPQKIKDLGPYDAVICAELLEHVVDPDKVLSEADKLGKHVLVTTPDGASSYQFFENRVNPHTNHSGHVRAYSRGELEGLMLRHGRLIESHVLRETDYIIVGEYAANDSVVDYPPVVIYCGPGLEDWNPDQIDREGLGGSETAVVKLAEELVKKNLRVMVYGPSEGVWNGVYYRHYSKFHPQNPIFTFIAWRNPTMFDLPLNAQVKYLWAHDTDFGEGLTEERANKIDGVMALSTWHVEHLSKTYPFLGDKLFIVGNGIDPERFAGTEDRIPTRFAYCSSPDRGLEQALDYWPKVRKAIPDAELHIFYGWINYDKMRRGREFKNYIGKLADQPGVVWRGRVGQKELARELMKCGGFFYPGPHPFEETFCIAALEAQAAGAYPVTRDNGALTETNKFGNKLPANSDAHDYIRCLTHAMTADREPMIAWAKAQTWESVADRLIARARQTFGANQAA
jgi:2-polyprenyl-3-methyl-5-hydroxy-6-metoxy-1,4-benzoquinol methylase/glycosyltransferase involved in cell wall biosynthesis